MNRIACLLAVVSLGLAAVGCGEEGKAVSPTAPEFKQPNAKPQGKPSGIQ